MDSVAAGQVLMGVQRRATHGDVAQDGMMSSPLPKPAPLLFGEFADGAVSQSPPPLSSPRPVDAATLAAAMNENLTVEPTLTCDSFSSESAPSAHAPSPCAPSPHILSVAGPLTPPRGFHYAGHHSGCARIEAVLFAQRAAALRKTGRRDSLGALPSEEVILQILPDVSAGIRMRCRPARGAFLDASRELFACLRGLGKASANARVNADFMAELCDNAAFAFCCFADCIEAAWAEDELFDNVPYSGEFLAVSRSLTYFEKPRADDREADVLFKSKLIEALKDPRVQTFLEKAKIFPCRDPQTPQMLVKSMMQRVVDFTLGKVSRAVVSRDVLATLHCIDERIASLREDLKPGEYYPGTHQREELAKLCETLLRPALVVLSGVFV